MREQTARPKAHDEQDKS